MQLKHPLCLCRKWLQQLIRQHILILLKLSLIDNSWWKVLYKLSKFVKLIRVLHYVDINVATKIVFKISILYKCISSRPKFNYRQSRKCILKTKEFGKFIWKIVDHRSHIKPIKVINSLHDICLFVGGSLTWLNTYDMCLYVFLILISILFFICAIKLKGCNHSVDKC